MSVGAPSLGHHDWDELDRLIVLASERELTEQQAARLKELITTDEQAGLHYIAVMYVQAGLRRRFRRGPRGDLDSTSLPIGCTNEEAVSPQCSPLPIQYPSAAYRAVGYLAAGWPVAYLIATVILGLGLVIGAVTHVSQPSQVVSHDPPSLAGQVAVGEGYRLPSPSGRDARREGEERLGSPLPSVVGQITGMVDCRFAVNSKIENPRPKTSVCLGDNLQLVSGLLEITYDAGARVILQGPVTFEVESNGGFLSLGRLTGKLDKGNDEIRMTNDEGEHAGRMTKSGRLQNSSFVIRPSSFTIRTPTATVTDPGTEFGVEVSDTGVTSASVFSGKVVMAGRVIPGTALSRVLTTGESARLVPHSTKIETVHGVQWSYVRTLPVQASRKKCELIEKIDYSDSWTTNSATRPGGCLLLNEPSVLRVEQSYGNPQRTWVFDSLSNMTSFPVGRVPKNWPGYQTPGVSSGFTESGVANELTFGLQYGLRDDFVVQCDAVQMVDRVNISIGDLPATIHCRQSVAVLFRAPGGPYPEIGLFTPRLGEVDTGLRSGIAGKPAWHNYAVRFNLAKRQLTVWIDHECRGQIDLNHVGKEAAKSAVAGWATVPCTNRCISIGGYTATVGERLWTDNFRIGSPSREATQKGRP